jgi:hypothetical protein
MNRLSQQDATWDQDQVNAIIADLAKLRLMADIELIAKYPYIGTKIYPLGRCREIRDAVFELLAQKLPTATEPGLVCLRNRLAQGQVLKKIWGALRGVYFQNAMAIGDWYLDVSNDTVNPNKPRIEVMPLATSGFVEITSFELFVEVAQHYWEVSVYRNDVCPALAPFMPLLLVAKCGTSWLGDATDEMLFVATNSQFRASEQVLNRLPPAPAEALLLWRQALSSISHNDFLHSQGDAVDFCQRYRTQGYHQHSAERDRAVMAYLTLPKGIVLN